MCSIRKSATLWKNKCLKLFNCITDTLGTPSQVLRVIPMISSNGGQTSRTRLSRLWSGCSAMPSGCSREIAPFSTHLRIDQLVTVTQQLKRRRGSLTGKEAFKAEWDAAEEMVGSG